MVGRWQSNLGVLRRSERGATAIEYALIAGLLGIGLLGSLVGTKTSLNAIFGVVSTQMGSASSDSTANAGLVLNPNNIRSAYWAAKTVATGPIHTSSSRTDTWTTTFTDGSSASITKYNDAPLIYEVTREANSLYSIETDYYNGVLSGVDAQKYSNNTWTNAVYAYYSNSFDANNNPKTMVFGPCSGYSCSLPNTTNSPPASFVQQVQNGVADLAIFAANEPQ